MSGYKKIGEIKKGFAQNPQNINKKGQPRKTIHIVNKELEEMGVSEATPKDIKGCYLRLMNISLGELTEMVNNKDQPSMVRIVGKAILSGKGFDVIERMLDRSLGKATQELNVNVESSTFEGMEKEDIEKRIGLFKE